MVTNFEHGLESIKKGRFHEAEIQFDAEFTQSLAPNFEVFKYYGLLLLKMGNYRGAISKFDAYLNNHPDDVICLLGKGIALDLLNKNQE